MTRQQAQRARLRCVEERRSVTELAGRLVRLRRELDDDPQVNSILHSAEDAAADCANQLDQLYTYLGGKV